MRQYILEQLLGQRKKIIKKEIAKYLKTNENE